MTDKHLLSERIERLALADFHAAASKEAGSALGLNSRNIGGALVSCTTNDPSILLNRTLGIATESPARPEHVSEIRQLHQKMNH